MRILSSSKSNYQLVLFYIIAILVYYLGYTVEYYKGNWEVSQSLSKNVLFVLFHLGIFLFNNHILIPKFIYQKRYLSYLTSIVLLVIIAGYTEEELLEQWLYPTSRGVNRFTYVYVYFYFSEILIGLFGFSCIKMVFDHLENSRKLAQIEQDKLSNELKFLKSQIQPHILFNSLNSIYEFTLSQSPKAPEMVLRLSNLLRYILYETDQHFVPLKKEIEVVQDYIALQQIQLEARGTVKLIQTLEDENYSYKIAPHLLIPFIENSFKHSMATISKGIHIQIQISGQNEQLIMSIQNNHDQSVQKKTALLEQGIGIENVKKRLELLYPNKHSLHIEETEQLYTVELNLSLEKWKN